MEKGCPKCGRLVDKTENKCPHCGYDFSEINKVFEHYKGKEKKQSKYAGFIKRTAATGIDILVLNLITTLIFLINLYVQGCDINTLNQNNLQLNLTWPVIIFPLIYLFYCTITQYSKQMGTYGEKILSIEILDKEDNPITLGQAFFRNLLRILNILTLFIGYLLIIFTKKKQSLSDILTKTYATNKSYTTIYENVRSANPLIRIIAYLIDTAFIYALFIAAKFGLLWINAFALSHQNQSQTLSIISIVFTVIMIIIIICYYPHMESKYGGTIGKLLCGIKVRTMEGKYISFWCSVRRLFCTLIENAILFGCLLCFVTPYNQTLKDILTKTVVTNER